MRKLSLLLPILLSFVSFASLTHASSEDITIGTKTYTQSEAQKQIVEPLLKRIEKQKIAKTKIRLVNLAIRQYTNKQKIAQKQGKIELAKFYSGIIDTLNGKMNTTNTGSTNSTENIASTNTSVTQNVVNTYTVNGMTFSLTAEQKKSSEAKVMSMKSGFCGDKGDFLMLIKQNGYANISYEYHFASTLSYQEYINGKMTCSAPYNANRGGIGTTSDQTGLSGIEYDQSKAKGEVKNTFDNSKYFGATRQQFLDEVIRQYGVGSYAYTYAQSLSY